MWNPRRGEIFSVLYFSLCAEKQAKCSDLLLFYVGVGTFKKRCLFNEFASVPRDYNYIKEGYLSSIVHVSRVSADEISRRDSFHDTLSIKFFVFLTHLEKKQQLIDISFLRREKFTIGKT